MNNFTPATRAARLLRAALFFSAAALLPSAAGALPFWMRLPEQASTYAPDIDNMFHLIMWITGVIFVIVELMLVFFLWRYRHREGRTAHYTHGNNRLEVVWTIVPALICVMLALLSRRIWDQIKENMPHEGLEIHVTGEQFAWNIRYAGPDGKFDTADDILTLNQIHFPVGKPVIVTLTSKDVIHSFFLPEFRVKQDAVPGMHTRIWFEGNKVGHWEIACAELCGLGHFRMKGFVTVDTPEDFQKWLAEQAATQTPEPPKAASKTIESAPAAAPAAQTAASDAKVAEKGGSS
ncbi:MAG TPA: cytochrome c oxidase subunit II [Thermoanaerobaculia bacterium]|nr:cytochrome c oxidase subunit II [Thermoanaerobaculia bacterium]